MRDVRPPRAWWGGSWGKGEGERALWSISDLENVGALLIAKDVGGGVLQKLGVDPRGMALPRFFCSLLIPGVHLILWKNGGGF